MNETKPINSEGGDMPVEKSLNPEIESAATNIEDGQESEQAIFNKRIGSKIGELYSVIKGKYADKDAGWSLTKLEADSPQRLAPIILEFRTLLRKGGAAEPDELIKELVSQAQDAAAKGKLKDEFTMKVLDRAANVPGSALDKLNRFFSEGLKKEAAKE